MLRQAITSKQRGLGVHGAWRYGSSHKVIEAKSMDNWSTSAWQCGLFYQAVTVVIDGFKALGAWRYMSPTKRFGYCNLGLLIL